MPRHLLLLAATVAAIGGVAASGAGAQTQTGPAPDQPVMPQPRDPNMPSVQNTVPEKLDGAGTGRTLSDKLEATGGVITPPNTGPDITVKPPTPEPNTTPVVPPRAIEPQAPQSK